MLLNSLFSSPLFSKRLSCKVGCSNQIDTFCCFLCWPPSAPHCCTFLQRSSVGADPLHISQSTYGTPPTSHRTETCSQKEAQKMHNQQQNAGWTRRCARRGSSLWLSAQIILLLKKMPINKEIVGSNPAASKQQLHSSKAQIDGVTHP